MTNNAVLISIFVSDHRHNCNIYNIWDWLCCSLKAPICCAFFWSLSNPFESDLDGSNTLAFSVLRLCRRNFGFIFVVNLGKIWNVILVVWMWICQPLIANAIYVDFMVGDNSTGFIFKWEPFLFYFRPPIFCQPFIPWKASDQWPKNLTLSSHLFQSPGRAPSCPPLNLTSAVKVFFAKLFHSSHPLLRKHVSQLLSKIW